MSLTSTTPDCSLRSSNSRRLMQVLRCMLALKTLRLI
jgi:hypothetical protein